MSLEGRVALVTGAGRGIGRAIACCLASHGAVVAVNDIDAEPAEAVASEIATAGGQARACPVSVLDYDASSAMVNELIATYGHVDILVSNAGVASSGKSILRTTLEEAERMMALNAFAPFVLCQAVLPSMRARKQGDIVVISSVAVEHMPPRSGPYSMAKAALEALAYTLAKEEAANGIRANVIAPGLIDTRLARLVRGRILHAQTGEAPDEELLGRGMTSPDAIAEAVLSYVVDPDPRRTAQKRTVGLASME